MNKIQYDTHITLSPSQADLLEIPVEARQINAIGCTVQKDIIEMYIKMYQGDFFSLLDKNPHKKREPLPSQHQEFLLLLIHSDQFNFDHRLGSANDHKSIIDYALEHNWDKVFDAIIMDKLPFESNVLISQGEYKGEIPLEIMIRKNDTTRAKMIIGKMGGNVLYPGCTMGYSALGCAAHHNNGEIVALLLEKGAYDFGPKGKCLAGKTLGESWDSLKELVLAQCGEEHWHDIMSDYPHLDKLTKDIGFDHLCQLFDIDLTDNAEVLGLYAQQLICSVHRDVKNLEHRDQMLLLLHTCTDMKSLAAVIISTQKNLLRLTQHFWQRSTDISNLLPKAVLAVAEINELLSAPNATFSKWHKMERRSSDHTHSHL